MFFVLTFQRIHILSEYDDLSVTFMSNLFSDFEYCNTYEMLASYLQITSYSKLTQENITLFNLTTGNNYYVSCRDKYQVVSSQYTANIFYQKNDTSITNSSVSNPGKYHIQDDKVIIEDNLGSITFANFILDENQNASLSNIKNSVIKKGCQFYIFQGVTYAIWQQQSYISIYNYDTKQESILMNISDTDDIELLTLRSQSDAKFIVIRVSKQLNTYDLEVNEEDGSLQLVQLNTLNLIDLYNYFQLHDNYVNVSTLLQYSRVTLFLEDYLVVQSQYQLIHNYIVFIRLSDMYIQCFNTPTTSSFYFTSNGIQGLYGVGVFENTNSNLANYDMTGLLEANEEQEYAPNNCWLIKDCVTSTNQNKSVYISLNEQATNQQCQTCDNTALTLLYKDFYQTLPLEYNGSHYFVQYNTSYPQICYEVCSNDYIMVQDNKLIGSYSVAFDFEFDSCYSVEGQYNLYVNNNFVTYNSTNQQQQATCMNDNPNITVQFLNSTTKGIQLPLRLDLEPLSLQQPTQPVSYGGYLSVNTHKIIDKNCEALISITSYTPSGYVYKKYNLKVNTTDVNIDSCYVGDNYMQIEYKAINQQLVLRPSYTITRFDHPCSLDTEDLQDFILQANINGYVTDIDKSSFTVDSDGYYVHEFYINSNLNRIQSAKLISTYENKQYTPQLSDISIPLSCLFVEDSFRFKNEDKYLVLMWMNSPKCNMRKLPDYDMIYVTIDGETYGFDDYSDDGLEYYIEYDFDHVDQIDFYITILGYKYINIKSYTNINVLDYNYNSYEDWQIPFAVYICVILIFYTSISFGYHKLKPQNQYQKLDNTEETQQEKQKDVKEKQKDLNDIFDVSQSDNKSQDENNDDIQNDFNSQDNSDSELYYGIPKPKYK